MSNVRHRRALYLTVILVPVFGLLAFCKLKLILVARVLIGVSDSLTFGRLESSFKELEAAEDGRVRSVSCWSPGAVFLVNQGRDRCLELDHVLRRELGLYRAFHVAEGRVQLLRGIWLGRAELSLFRRLFLSDVLWSRQSCTGRVRRVNSLSLCRRFDLCLLNGVQSSSR